MNEQPRIRLGTISIWLALVPLLALISWFVFYRPCGSLLRAFIENTVIYGTIVAFSFSFVAVFHDKPKKRAWIGLSISSVPLICFVTLVAAIVYSIAAGSTGFPGKMELMYSGSTNTPTPSPVLDPGVFINTETKYYAVSGSSERELTAQYTSRGPAGYMAETLPSYHWSYLFREQDGTCRIEKVRVEALITFTYPRWDNPSRDEKLAEWWSRCLASVEGHERGHEIIARDASRDIYDALYYLPPSPSCNELKLAIDAKAKAVVEEAQKAQEKYDRETDHGRHQTSLNP